MDACSDPRVERIVVQSSAQVGKTSVVENLIGYYIDQDPSPILLVEPTLDKAEEFSKERLAPMLRDTPCLRGKVKEARTRDSGNTLLAKIFPGGHLAIAGANSPAGLASRPRRVVIGDEVDRMEASAGSEGDPLKLAEKRTTTFWNRKIIWISTPGNEETSRIAAEFKRGDQRRFHVPCPHCGHKQVLRWEQVKWKKQLLDGTAVFDPPKGYSGPTVNLPQTAVYGCEQCHKPWGDARRWAAIRWGEWRASQPFRGIASFHLNEIYSSWVKLSEMVAAFLEAKEYPELLKVWVNTALGETWKEKRGEAPAWALIKARAESYALMTLPPGVLLLACGVDTQNDRLAPIIRGFGRGEESWLIYRGEIYGDPIYEEVLEELDKLIFQTFHHPYGGELFIPCTAIDSGGGRTQAVYNYVRKRSPRVIATKGMSRPGLPVIAGRPTAQDVTFGGKIEKDGVMLWPIGADTAKSEIYARLKIDKPGPRYMHFPDCLPDDYYEQVTSERVVTKYSKGVPFSEWVLPPGKRNEDLDAEALCYAAAIRAGLLRADWDTLEAAVRVKVDELDDEAEEQPQVVRSKWVHGGR